MLTCAIQWIDGNGQPTPDEKPAIGRVRLREHFEYHAGRQLKFGDNEKWYTICACHAKQLNDPGMEHWELEAY